MKLNYKRLGQMCNLKPYQVIELIRICKRKMTELKKAGNTLAVSDKKDWNEQWREG